MNRHSEATTDSQDARDHSRVVFALSQLTQPTGSCFGSTWWGPFLLPQDFANVPVDLISETCSAMLKSRSCPTCHDSRLQSFCVQHMFSLKTGNDAYGAYLKVTSEHESLIWCLTLSTFRQLSACPQALALADEARGRSNVVMCKNMLSKLR